jgi:SAM-dependent methyltransferase
MHADLEARVQRERQAHNAGISRDRYDRVFRHAGHFYRQKRMDVLAATFSEHQAGHFLELGSMSWAWWIEPLGIKPHSLTCINISEAELQKGVDLAARSKTKPDFRLMDAHELDFPDNTFNVVYGVGILHHLDYERALLEVLRVLKPGGAMIFYEPLALNPAAMIVRWLTPHARTVDEQPLRLRELALCKRLFHTTLHYEQLFSVPAGIISGFVQHNPENWLTKWGFVADEALLKIAPWMGPLYRMVLITGRKQQH